MNKASIIQPWKKVCILPNFAPERRRTGSGNGGTVETWNSGRPVFWSIGEPSLTRLSIHQDVHPIGGQMLSYGVVLGPSSPTQ